MSKKLVGDKFLHSHMGVEAKLAYFGQMDEGHVIVDFEDWKIAKAFLEHNRQLLEDFINPPSKGPQEEVKESSGMAFSIPPILPIPPIPPIPSIPSIKPIKPATPGDTMAWPRSPVEPNIPKHPEESEGPEYSEGPIHQKPYERCAAAESEPLLEPCSSWLAARSNALIEAIRYKLATGQSIPASWIDNYNWVQTELLRPNG